MDVATALREFVGRYQDAYPLLEEVYDPDWRSPCEQGDPYQREDGIQRIRWQPLARPPGSGDADFGPLERAIESPVHPDIKAYYGSYWSGGLEAEATDGHVSLILLWNDDDRLRLIENLLGHVLAKRRSRSPFSVFFACTEVDSELFLAVDNATGAVLLERPGYPPLRQVADSMGEFISSLAPAPPELHPERQLLGPTAS